MYKILLNYFFILLLLGDGVSYSQSFRIVGQVVNATTQPVEFMDVYLTTSTASNMPHTYTDSLGNFTLQAVRGSYTLTLAEFGKEKYSQVITLTQDLNLGQLTVDEGVMLDSITITAKKKLIERKVDRLVFHVENSVVSQGGNVLDVLNIAPNISVRNNQIIIIGKSELSVMINNKMLKLSGDDLLGYLKNIKSEDISTIEVITNPPANYEAEGNSGIININLKRETQKDWYVDLGAFFKQSKYSQVGQTLIVAYTKKAISFYGSINHNDGLYFNRTEDTTIYYSDKMYRSLSEMKYDYRANNAINLGLDYELNKKTTIGIQYLVTDNTIKGEEKNDTYIENEEKYLLQTLSTTNIEKRNGSLNFYSTYKIDSIGSKAMLNVDYFNYSSNNSRSFITKQYDDFIHYVSGNDYQAENGSKQDIKNYATQLDIEQKLNGVDISYGAKFSHTQNNSQSRFQALNSEMLALKDGTNDGTNDDFTYAESIAAVYISGSKKIGKHLEITAGLRVERTNTKGNSTTLSQTNNNLYTKLFPTVYFMYKLNEFHAFSLNYGRRINRPSYSILNPFVRYINQTTTSEGNPFLQPYQTDNYELNYNYKNNWNTTVYLSTSNNIFNQVNYITNDNINSITKYENFYNQFTWGITENYRFNPFHFMESVLAATIYNKQIKSSLPQTLQSYQSWSAFFQLGNEIFLTKNKNWVIVMNYWAQLSEYESIYKRKALSSFDVGFKAVFLNQSLVLSMYGADLLRTAKMDNVSNFNGIVNHAKNYEDRQFIRIAVNYTLGKSSFRSNENKPSNEEEKNRSN
ncbi:outer membrane beta-barrel family protein [Myroides fluvii]|uniref:outer membrane beta-barrel family protein n=1 Tax=Myroides fluvii TaxID=2572594 RepID=UPI00131A99EA|nr:outer membrane beta-barrel family protein [Myroides fluvii]